MDEITRINNIKWYKKTYENLINTRKYRGTKKKRGDGYNKHHIIPKCLGGKDEESNYVLLTFREHIVAHMLLHKIYPNSSELSYALLRMMQSSSSGRKENIYKLDKDGNPITPLTRELEELRNQSVEYLRNINTGKHHSEETKEKIRKAKTGVKYSEETRQLLSKQRLGHVVKESTREKISKSRVGIVFSKKQREKLSKARRGTKLSESAKKAISGKNSITARKVIDPNGVEYDTVRLCAEAYGVKDNTVRKWIKNPNKEFSYSNDISGKSFYESISRKVIGPDGTIYPSLVKCAKAIGRTKGTVKRWIEKFPEKGFKYYTKDK